MRIKSLNAANTVSVESTDLQNNRQDVKAENFCLFYFSPGKHRRCLLS